MTLSGDFYHKDDIGLFVRKAVIARPVTVAKFTVCSIIKLATIAFHETSSYWPAPKSS